MSGKTMIVGWSVTRNYDIILNLLLYCLVRGTVAGVLYPDRLVLIAIFFLLVCFMTCELIDMLCFSFIYTCFTVS